MQRELKDKFPNWCEDSNSEYDLILSDDFDSLASCTLQKHLFNRNINYFIDWNQSYLKDGFTKQACQIAYRIKKSDKKTIGIDVWCYVKKKYKLK